MDRKVYDEYIAILKEELVPAMGCTEPIALAFGAAKAREVLGCMPEKIIAKCSGNIVKNVRCVTIPNSGGMTGIAAGVVLGAVGGRSEKLMEVLEDVTLEDVKKTRAYLAKDLCQVELLDTPVVLHIILEFYAGQDQVTVEIKYSHTNISRIEKNGEVLFFNDEEGEEPEQADRSL